MRLTRRNGLAASPVGFHKSVTYAEQQRYAARWYSLTLLFLSRFLGCFVLSCEPVRLVHALVVVFGFIAVVRARNSWRAM